MRAVVQGLPIDEVWDRYLRVEGERTDARVVRSTVLWIRSEFSAVSKRYDRPGTARLFRLDVARLVRPGPVLPSLAQFAEEAGLEDESEREQLAAYEACYGPATGRQTRQARLLRRQLEALRWLEALAAREPVAGDAVSAWLRPELALRLASVGILTIEQLVERINGLGLGWSRAIAGIGVLKAGRIAAWLREHETSIGQKLGPHTLVRRSQVAPKALASVVAPAADVRPLEKLTVPRELDGQQGRYRRPQAECMLGATNDYDAILAWLRAKRGPSASAGGNPETDLTGMPKALSHTQRAYRKEAERFLLWAIVARGKALSSMTAEDCTAYREFLADPQPRARWCGERARQRWSPLWRPFEGPLSVSAQRQAVTVLKSLFEFLAKQCYLIGNPWSAVTIPRPIRPGLDTARSLTMANWQFIRDGAAAVPGLGGMRLRIALGLLYATGLRASELVAARAGDLSAVEYLSPQTGEVVRGWMLQVVGKGQKLREVPVPDELVVDIGEYFKARGLPGDVTTLANQMVALLGMDSGAGYGLRTVSANPGQGIGNAALYTLLKGFFLACGKALQASGDSTGAARLARASTHWIRHTHATQALASGVSVEIAQQNLGHASMATTTAYVTTERARRMQAMRKLWAPGGAIQ